jgi:hypothetical protein
MAAVFIYYFLDMGWLQELAKYESRYLFRGWPYSLHVGIYVPCFSL